MVSLVEYNGNVVRLKGPQASCISLRTKMVTSCKEKCNSGDLL